MIPRSVVSLFILAPLEHPKGRVYRRVVHSLCCSYDHKASISPYVNYIIKHYLYLEYHWHIDKENWVKEDLNLQMNENNGKNKKTNQLETPPINQIHPYWMIPNWNKEPPWNKCIFVCYQSMRSSKQRKITGESKK